MFAKRIIPCLDCKDGRVVKGIRFVNLRDAGDPGDLAEMYNREGADELVMLDISASREGRATLMETVRRVARRLFIPLTVGGGVRLLEDARRLLSAGADKVAVNTAAVETPEVIKTIAENYGRQALVVAIDARRVRGSLLSVTPDTHRVAQGPLSGPAALPDSPQEPQGQKTGPALPQAAALPDSPQEPQGQKTGPALHGPEALPTKSESPRWEVVTYGGTQPTGIDALAWAQQVEDLGAGEILLTSMDADGTQAGFDCVLTAAVARALHIPVIASGGAGNPEHIAEVFLRGYADAALAASIFHYETHSIRSLKEYLRSRGVPVRI
jgi:cyclase